MEGAAAPYAEDIAKFISIRMAVTETGSREHYRHLIRRLCGDVNRRSQGLEITVPVFYVKNYLGGNFKMGDKDMLSRQTTLSLNNSQVYKDLTRDHISINGLVVSGAAMGAEGMIGKSIRTPTPTYIHLYIYAHTHIYIYIYSYIFIHTHTHIYRGSMSYDCREG